MKLAAAVAVSVSVGVVTGVIALTAYSLWALVDAIEAGSSD